MKKLRVWEFLQESNGTYSSARLFAFIIVISAVIEWQKAIWLGPGIWSPDIGTVGLIAGVLGIKVLQKGSEEKVITPESPEVPKEKVKSKKESEEA